MFTTMRCCVAALAIFCALMLATSSSQAEFIALGNSGWEYDATGSGLKVAHFGTTGATTTFTVSGNMRSLEPLVIQFQTMANFTEVERFFMMDLSLTNTHPTSTWTGFTIDTADAFDQVEGNAFHPVWAHIHPEHNVGGGPNYGPFANHSPFGGTGVPEMHLSGGTVAPSATFNAQRIRLHDMANIDGEAGIMAFDLILTPSRAVPAPGSLALLACCGLMQKRRRRR